MGPSLNSLSPFSEKLRVKLKYMGPSVNSLPQFSEKLMKPSYKIENSGNL